MSSTRQKIVFILFFLITSATPSEAADPETWRICGSSADCVIIPTYCGGWAAVNHDHAQEARQYYDAIGALKKCRAGEARRPDHPTCVNNLCEPANVWNISHDAKSDSPQAEPAAPLQLTITSEKTVYAVGEKVKIAVKLENIYGEKLQVVDFANAYDYLTTSSVLKFEIKDSQGQRLNFHNVVLDYFPGDKNLWLNSGDGMETAITINDEKQPNHVQFSSPGEYQIAVEYFDFFDYEDYTGTIHWKKASSNVVTIQIGEVKE